MSLLSTGKSVNYCSRGYYDEPVAAFLEVYYTDQLFGKTQIIYFIEKDNQEVEIDGNKMILIAGDGKKEIILLVFEFANLEKDID